MSKSETNTPASTSSTSTLYCVKNESVTLAEEIKKYDTGKLIEFLRGEKE